MNVCFFRHGIAVEPGTPGVAEQARRLTDDGRRKTRQAARGLKRLKPALDLVLTSPLPRARETAEILAEVLGLPRPRTAEPLLPGKPAVGVMELLKSLGEKSALLVGHEPLLSAAVSLLVTGLESGDIRLKKAGMAFARVKTLTPRPRGSLLLVLTPAALRQLAKQD